MQELQHKTVQALCDITASDTSLPGGGSIAAMAGAYGAALAQMMAKLTMEREKYKDVEPRMREVDTALEPLRLQLLEGITKDSHSFGGYMQALRLPKDTEEEKAIRREAMQRELKNACAVPLQNAKDALTALEMAIEVVEVGNLTTLSDGLVGVFMLRAAAMGALDNVRVNLPGIHDEAYRAEMLATCSRLEAQANAMEQQAVQIARKREEARLA